MNTLEHNGIIIRNKARDDKENEFAIRYKPPDLQYDISAFCNKTNEAIPEDIAFALSLGPKFMFPDDNPIKKLELIAETENVIENNFTFEANMARIKSAQIFKNKIRMPNTRMKNWMKFCKYRREKFMENNPDKIAIKSDKGKVMVLMYDEEYRIMIDKMVDSNEYEKLRNSPLDKLQNMLKGYLYGFIRRGIIKKEEFDKYFDNGGEIAKFYGLPKIHKETLKLRPIVAGIGSVGYETSKLMKKYLDKWFPPKDLNIKKSTEVKEAIDKIAVDKDDIMVSFDVVSMFTSIPIRIIIGILEDNRERIKKIEGTDVDIIIRCIGFLIEKCAVFKVNNEHFRQLKGIAMGSVLSPLLARIVMEKIITTTINKLDIKPSFFKVYVDDSLCVIKRNGVKKLLEELNKFDDNISFTVEVEKDNTINFLDITFIRRENEIVTKWYKKPFASYRFVNYYSEHDIHTATDTAITLIKNVIKLSSPEFFQENKTTIEKILRLNNFPETEIIGIMTKYYTLMKKDVAKPNNFIKMDKRIVSLPLIYPLTDLIIKEFIQLNNNRIYVKRPNMGNFMGSQIKDKIEESQLSNGIVINKCQCGKYSFTELPKNSNLEEIRKKTIKNGKCDGETHKIRNCRYFRRTREQIRKKTIELLAYINRDRMMYKHVSPPKTWRNLIDNNPTLFKKMKINTRKNTKK